MSHLRQVGVLAHNQPVISPRVTPVSADVAELLVQRMLAERISQKLIRMFPPRSVFPVAKFYAETARYIPEKLPPAEVANCRFERPASDLMRISTMPRTRNLSRFRDVYGDWQMAHSLPSPAVGAS